MLMELLSWFSYEYEWYLKSKSCYEELAVNDEKKIRGIWYIQMEMHKENVERLKGIITLNYNNGEKILNEIKKDVKERIRKIYNP